MHHSSHHFPHILTNLSTTVNTKVATKQPAVYSQTISTYSRRLVYHTRRFCRQQSIIIDTRINYKSRWLRPRFAARFGHHGHTGMVHMSILVRRGTATYWRRWYIHGEFRSRTAALRDVAVKTLSKVGILGVSNNI